MKNVQKSSEAWGNCEHGWKPGEGNGKRESSGKTIGLASMPKCGTTTSDHATVTS